MGDPELQAWEVFRQEKEGDAMKHGGSVIAFVEDPDGYKIEFIERKPA